MEPADPYRATLVARRTELQSKINALRQALVTLDQELATHDAKVGLSRRLANLSPAERDLLDQMAEQRAAAQMGLLNPDGTRRPRPK